MEDGGWKVEEQGEYPVVVGESPSTKMGFYGGGACSSDSDTRLDTHVLE